MSDIEKIVNKVVTNHMKAQTDELSKAVTESVLSYLNGAVQKIADQSGLEESYIRGMIALNTDEAPVKQRPRMCRKQEPEKVTNLLPGRIYIVTDYTNKSVGIFGETRKIKDDILKPNHCKYNSNLAYGPGWIISSKQLPVLMKALRDEDVTSLTKAEFEEELQFGNGKVELPPETPTVGETANNSDESTKSDTKKKKKIYLNQHGNHEDKKTGLVFKIKSDGSKKVIGIQNEDGSIGLIPKEMVAHCDKKGWAYSKKKVQS